MALDIDALVAPLSDDQPSGPDLYGDLKRQQIEQAFERSVSDDSASDTSAAKWQDTIDQIIEQCEITRDLWLPVYLIRAATQAGQFDLVVEAASFLAALIETRWADVHPQLDDLGFIGRKTPCESLTRIGDFLGPLEKMPLVIHPRLGSFSGADFEKFRDKGPKASGFAEFRKALEAMGDAAVEQAADGIDTLTAAIRSVDATLTANADGDTGTNFKPTYDLLAKMKKAVAAFLPKAEANSPDTGSESTGDSDMESQSSMSSGPGFTGGISNRDDVVRAIDAICSYYARAEPGSPVPFVLRRARDWISLDFMAVLEDIAPGSIEEAMRVLKSQKSESESTGDWGNTAAAEPEWGAEEEAEPAAGGDDGWN